MASSSSSSSRSLLIPGPCGSKRTRSSCGVGAAGEEAMAWKAAVVKREVRAERKEEVDAESEAAWPRPLEGLSQAGPAPFVVKTYEMVEEASTDAVVSWAAGPDGSRSSFVVWDPPALATGILPRFFKHSNFASFVRQLNTYGFRKASPDRWEFMNEAFLAGQKHLLRNIRRRRPSKHHTQSKLRNRLNISYGQPEFLNVVGSLKKDHAALRAEVIMLKKQYGICKSQLIAMEERVLNNERKQRQIITFFAKALSNPVFVQRILAKYANTEELGGATKRQRLMENEGHHAVNAPEAAPATEREAGFSAGSSECGTVVSDELMPTWNDQDIGDMCDDVWEELGAIPGTEMKQEEKADICFDVEEFTGRPCGWVDDCLFLVEPMQFVE